jgi:MFS family permease
MWRSVYVPSIILTFAEGLLVPVLPLYLASLGVSFWWIGLVLAAEAIGMLVGDLPAGALLRRMNRRVSMLSGLLLLAVTAFASAFAATAWLLFITRWVAGLGWALWWMSRHAYLTQTVPVRQRGRVIAAYGGAQRVGSLIGPAVGGVVAVAFGFAAPFFVYGVAAIATMAVVWGLPDGAERSVASGHGHGNSRAAWRLIAAMGPRLLASAGLGVLMAQAVRAGRRVVIPLFGATVLGLDAQQVGFIVSLTALIDFAFFPLAGVLMDRFGRKAAIVPSFVLQTLGMLLVPLSGGFAGLLAAGLLIGFGNGIGSGTMMTVGADLAPEGATGEFLGAWHLVGDGGAMGSPVLVGALADGLGLAGATVVVAFSGVAAAMLFAWGVPETAGPKARSLA